MRTLRKRLVCSNRNDYKKNSDAMAKIEQRYLNKMSKNGWELYVNANTDNGFAAAGNAFFCWERYITLVKYNDKEKDLRLQRIRDSQEVWSKS